jgi:calcium-dependent protein kinase
MSGEAQTSAQIVQAFKRFDKDGDGTISREELAGTLRLLGGKKFDEETIDTLMKAADLNGDGKIQYEEFTSWVMKDQNAEKPAEKFAPLDKRGSFACDFKALLPERFDVDVKERYNLDKLQLGEGGYGKVFQARDKECADRSVAIKCVCKTDGTSGGETSEALAREIDVMKTLDHPNICKLLATFEQGKTMFFVMELCEGGELFDKIVNSGVGHLTEKYSSIIVHQVAAALAYTHNLGIAHRDLKPENVVFCSKEPEDTNIKVIDWGLAMSFTGTRMTAAVGSFTYAAPEVICSKNVLTYTSACDLWSLGVLTYVMLSGKPPFWGSTKQHLDNAKQEKYPLKGSPWDKMNASAKDFVKVLIKANPKQRMEIQDVVKHPWFTSVRRNSAAPEEDSADVFKNLQQFSNGSTFTKMCMVAVARQLDHKGLKDIHQVFRDMDVNGDGVLSFQEVSDGFKKIFGEDSPQYKDVKDTFGKLDLDGSGTIDYTEFCAAGLGSRAASQEDAIWAAFKTFDVSNTGKITKEDLTKILDKSDVTDVWSAKVCAEVAQEILNKFADVGDGMISFEDFKKMMKDLWDKSQAPTIGGIAIPGLSGFSAYDMLAEVNALGPPPTS